MSHGKDTGTRNTVVLYGTGGMGKTQLALEYVYRYHKEYSSIFWVNVGNKQTIHIGFTETLQQLIDHHANLSRNPDYSHISQLLRVSGQLDSAGKLVHAARGDTSGMEIINAVRQWFAEPENTKWLLVLDNLDDLESFDINEYIPICVHGTVVITSRRRESTQGRKAIEIQEMQDHEAKALLLKSAQRTELEGSGK